MTMKIILKEWIDAVYLKVLTFGKGPGDNGCDGVEDDNEDDGNEDVNDDDVYDNGEELICILCMQQKFGVLVAIVCNTLFILLLLSSSPSSSSSSSS